MPSVESPGPRPKPLRLRALGGGLKGFEFCPKNDAVDGQAWGSNTVELATIGGTFIEMWA